MSTFRHCPSKYLSTQPLLNALLELGLCEQDVLSHHRVIFLKRKLVWDISRVLCGLYNIKWLQNSTAGIASENPYHVEESSPGGAN